VLFQSDVRHSEFVQLAVHEATRKRDLKHDWVHPGKVVCEISLSMSQFASFVASGGTEGVPCTIEFTGSGDHEPGQRPGLLPAPRLALAHEEVRAAADEAYGHIQEAYAAYAATLADAGKGSAAARRSALRNLSSAFAIAAPNVDYAARTLGRHTEEVVEQARADIEAMAVQVAARHGISPIEIQAIEAAGIKGKLSIKNQQGSANPYACVCGYDGSSRQDLDEHIVAASDEDDHAWARP
jgi:hypothetical protein